MKKPYLPVSALILFLFLIIACKKSHKAEDALAGVTVSFLNTGLQDAFVRYSSDTTYYNAIIKMEGESFVVPNKIVSVELEPSLLSAYNTANGTNFELLPDSVYTLATAFDTIFTGSGQAQLPIQVVTRKINPFAKYVLPLKLQSADLNIDALANTTLLRIILSNDYTGVYTDTISSLTTAPTYPTPPRALNFTDSVIQKTLTALNDTTVIMEMFLHTLVMNDKYLIMRLDTTTSNVSLSFYDATSAEITQFALANVGLVSYYRPADKYFNIPYNYFTTDLQIKERLKKQ